VVPEANQKAQQALIIPGDMEAAEVSEKISRIFSTGLRRYVAACKLRHM
jgi:hypothetical protein